MLKSNNFNSIVDDLPALSSTASTLSTLQGQSNTKNSDTGDSTDLNETKTNINTGKFEKSDNAVTQTAKTTVPEATTTAALQLTAGVLQSYALPIARAKGQLKELIQKQNKIYIDLSAEKFKLDNAEVAKLHDMMINVKMCREKLLKIKKHMQNIYQRTKVLKKRAVNIQTCKEKELQRKLQKQRQEESLIGKQPQ